MYLLILFCNVCSKLHCSMVRIFCLYRTASPNNDTHLQTTGIDKTFDLDIKFVYQVITLHQIEEKGDEYQKYASLLNLEYNIEEEAHFHIPNKLIKKIILIKSFGYGGNCTNRTRCGTPEH